MTNKILESPQDLVFFVTDRCNLRCSHCFYWHSLTSPAPELDLGQIKTTISSFKKPLYKVTLTGGEPFLRKDLAEICKILYKFSKAEHVYIITNGYFPEIIHNTARKVLETTKLRLYIPVSLDGLKQTHNRIRKDGDSFDNAVRTIQRLKNLEKKFNFEVRVTTAVSQRNMPELESLASFVRQELKVMLHLFEITRDMNFFGQIPRDIEVKDYGPEDKTILLSAEQLKRLKSKINEFYLVKPIGNIVNLFYRTYHANILKASIDSILKRKRTSPCSAGNSIGVIYANGDVALCEITKPIENLKEVNFDFNKIWHSEEANKRRRQISSCYCSNTCYSFASFRYRRSRIIEGLKKACLLKQSS